MIPNNRDDAGQTVERRSQDETRRQWRQVEAEPDEQHHDHSVLDQAEQGERADLRNQIFPGPQRRYHLRLQRTLALFELDETADKIEGVEQ